MRRRRAGRGNREGEAGGVGRRAAERAAAAQPAASGGHGAKPGARSGARDAMAPAARGGAAPAWKQIESMACSAPPTFRTVTWRPSTFACTRPPSGMSLPHTRTHSPPAAAAAAPGAAAAAAPAAAGAEDDGSMVAAAGLRLDATAAPLPSAAAPEEALRALLARPTALQLSLLFCFASLLAECRRRRVLKGREHTTNQTKTTGRGTCSRRRLMGGEESPAAWRSRPFVCLLCRELCREPVTLV